MKIKTWYIWIIIVVNSCSPDQNKGDTVTGPKPVRIQVNFNDIKGPMIPLWAWFGYDEPNYTYMQDGKKLLAELAELSPVPVYIRTHNLLTSGDGKPALKWGSTNAYTEDKKGDAVYNWTIVDSIFDTYIHLGMKPLVEIGFMPEALSVKPEPYKHKWRPGVPYSDIFTGWAYPPKNYRKWADLVYQWVRHSVDRYGKAEVESWYWELWNEPNIGYWQGTTEEYLKLFDYTADAVKRALPDARIGGPHVTGPSWDVSKKFLKTFLDHIYRGKNYVTGEEGTPLDYIGFHAKGAPVLVDSIIQMNMGTQLRDISDGFEIVASYPQFKILPVIIGESDPEGCAACSMQDYPSNAYRNGTMYSSYTAASFARLYDFADHYGVKLRGVVTWAFEFENQPWFNGYRDLATNGVDKPVLNVFRMLGMMSGNRVGVSGDLAYDYMAIRDSSVRGEKTDISALAAIDSNTATIMVWNYHDLNITGTTSPVVISVTGIPAERAWLWHYRIDDEHSNAYTAWKKMGSPQNPDSEQYAELKRSGQLEMLNEPKKIKLKKNAFIIKMELPRQGVSLVKLTW